MTKTDYGYRYTTRPMASYKERLEKFSENVSGHIIPVKGMGEEINIPPGIKTHPKTSSLFSAGSSSMDWKDFLSNYKEKLMNLPNPEGSVPIYFSGLDYTEMDIWTTLFPIAAVFRKKYKGIYKSAAEILTDVRNWAFDVINMYL